MDGADGAAAVAGVAAAAVGFGAVAEAAGDAVEFFDGGGAPVVAEAIFTLLIGWMAESVAGGYDEDALAVGTYGEVAVDAVDFCKFPFTVFYEFLVFLVGGHAPTVAPVCGCGVVALG